MPAATASAPDYHSEPSAVCAASRLLEAIPALTSPSSLSSAPTVDDCSDPTAREPMQFVADPLADAVVAEIIGTWAISSETASAKDLLLLHARHWRRLQIANRMMTTWIDNSGLPSWKAPFSDDTADSDEAAVGKALEAYLRTAYTLPEWADAAKIERAETIFMEYGVLSCVLLFCASLPECYVIPDLAAVLHVAGQLEHHTEYRIRSTAAMIFPVMMQGGLSTGQGAGVAQTLKVRLIHATIRNLILRESPESAVTSLRTEASGTGSADATMLGVVPPLAALAGSHNLHQALFAHGWKLGEDGLPCNQEELAYTLLTFGYIFLRGLRTLGLGLNREDEEAYLHAWNVMAHVLGVERVLMPQTMAEAETLFNLMQARGRADQSMPGGGDARPALGQALMKSLEDVIPSRLIKPFPTLLTRRLCGATVAKEIGINGRVSWFSRALFYVVMWGIRGIDAVLRLAFPEFSISRFITRVVGYQFMSKFLMDQTRPLKLPTHLVAAVSDMMSAWSEDPKAPKWLNKLEDRLTTRGDWQVAATTHTAQATKAASTAQSESTSAAR